MQRQNKKLPDTQPKHKRPKKGSGSNGHSSESKATGGGGHSRGNHHSQVSTSASAPQISASQPGALKSGHRSTQSQGGDRHSNNNNHPRGSSSTPALSSRTHGHSQQGHRPSPATITSANSAAAAVVDVPELSFIEVKVEDPRRSTSAHVIEALNTSPAESKKCCPTIRSVCPKLPSVPECFNSKVIMLCTSFVGVVLGVAGLIGTYAQAPLLSSNAKIALSCVSAALLILGALAFYRAHKLQKIEEANQPATPRSGPVAARV